MTVQSSHGGEKERREREIAFVLSFPALSFRCHAGKTHWLHFFLQNTTSEDGKKHQKNIFKAIIG